MHWIVTFLFIDFFLCTSNVKGVKESNNYQQAMPISKSKNGEIHRRSKRSLLNFHRVIQCLQPWASVLSVYGDYGCYCGFSGHGRPLDDTDKCCYYHDKCYELAGFKAESWSEWSMGSYFTSYGFECTENHTVICDKENNNKYEHALCECDKEAAVCFLENRNTYSEMLYDINVEKYCKEQANFDDLHLNTHNLHKLYSCVLRPDQDKCCIDKGYNSALELCCNGEIRRYPNALRNNFQCCEGKFYDIRRRICCYGYLHPNAAPYECCGTSGAKVDRRIEQCVDGKPVVLPSRNKTLNTSAPSER